MVLKPRIMMHSRLVAPTVPVIGRRGSRQSWTPAPAPHVHFASLGERAVEPIGAKLPRDGSEYESGPERSAMLMPTISACRDMTSLQEVISNRSQDFNHPHVCAAMEKVVETIAISTDSELTAQAQQLMRELSVLALDFVHDMDAPALGSVLGALSKAGGTPNPSLVHKILQHAEANLHSFDSYDNLQVLWAMAYLGVDSHSELMHDLLSAGTTGPHPVIPARHYLAAGNQAQTK
eukprot:gene19438-26096_t